MAFYNNLGESGMRLDNIYQPTKLTIETLQKTNKSDTAKQIGISRNTLTSITKGKPTDIKTATKISGFHSIKFDKAFIPVAETKTLSDRTISHHHRLISSILTTAVQWQLIDSNPAQRLKPPEIKKKKANSYDDTQILQLFSALDSAPLNYRTMIYLVSIRGV